MESLNMSKLNLSSVRNQQSSDLEGKPNTDVTADPIVLMEEDKEVCDYKDDIWLHLLHEETQKTTLHLQSPQLEFRGALVQQLRDATKKLGLSMGTLHSAVTQLDLFMDAHRLRADRLTHVALACLSLAAKSEEKFSRAPTLKTLSKISGVQLCGKTFRQLEWMVGQHIKWKLLAPTPVSFAMLLAQFIVTDLDLTTRHPKFVYRFKRDGAKFLEAYLDLTLSDVRLKVVESVNIGCACIACARVELGLVAWPTWLANKANRTATEITPIARLLQRMMQILKSRNMPENVEPDQGYCSAKTTPNLTPCTSPMIHSFSTEIEQGTNSYSVLDLQNTNVHIRGEDKISNPLDYKYSRTRRLLEAGLGSVETMAVKRGLENNVEVDSKRYRLTTQLSQVVI